MSEIKRFTKDIVQKILDQNNGVEITKSYGEKHFSCTYIYRVIDGVMHTTQMGKTVWSNSRFNNAYICDIDTARRVIKNNLYKFKLVL